LIANIKISTNKYISIFGLVIAVLLLACLLIFPNYFNTIQYILFAVGLLTVGFPHGAIDHLLINGLYHNKINYQFILRYITLFFGYFLLWIFFPNLSMIIFLAFSIWHFGQCDLQEWQLRRSNNFKIILWGTLLFGIILLGHLSETNSILVNLGVTPLAIPSFIANKIGTILAIMGLFWSFLERKMAMTYCILMLTIGLFLPLLTSFAIYFIAQHSLFGWMHLKKELNTNNLTLYKKALPFNLAAIFFFIVTIYLIQTGLVKTKKTDFTALFFMFVACISLPHVIAMNKFYQKTFTPALQDLQP
jgi:Brp/Blh family beta-carotene 15,15'-monooxygenase